jgi:hypothetical protein
MGICKDPRRIWRSAELVPASAAPQADAAHPFAAEQGIAGFVDGNELVNLDFPAQQK